MHVIREGFDPYLNVCIAPGYVLKGLTINLFELYFKLLPK